MVVGMGVEAMERVGMGVVLGGLSGLGCLGCQWVERIWVEWVQVDLVGVRWGKHKDGEPLWESDEMGSEKSGEEC